MELGLTLEKFLLIAVLAAVVIGPARLPEAAAKFAHWIRQLGDMARGAKDTIKEEMGDAAGDLDWRSLDPRQYDPRRIIRDALVDGSGQSIDPRKLVKDAWSDAPAGTAPAGVPAQSTRASVAPRTFSAASPPPFDPEAT